MCCVPTARRLASERKANLKLNYSQRLETVQRDIDNVNKNDTSTTYNNTDRGGRAGAAVVSTSTYATATAASTSDNDNEEDETTFGGCGRPSPWSYIFTKQPQAPAVTASAAAAEVVVSSELVDVATAAAPLGYTASGKKRRKRIRKKLSPGLTAMHKERQFVKHNYHDHSHDDPAEYLLLEQAAQESNTSVQHSLQLQAISTISSSQCTYHHQPKLCGGPGNSGGVPVPFPFKLHAMLDQIEADGFANVVSWQPHGRSFVIHDKKSFVAKIMPQYFNQTKLTSFQRQLNLYGYTRLSRGTDKGGYYHELFLKHMPFLCHKMIRVKCKGVGFKAASDPDSEPNFYDDNVNMGYVTHSQDYWKAYRPKKSLSAEEEPSLSLPRKQDATTRLIDVNPHENSSHDESHTNVVSSGGSSGDDHEDAPANNNKDRVLYEEDDDDLLLASLFKNAVQEQLQDPLQFRTTPMAAFQDSSSFEFEAAPLATTPPSYFNCGGALTPQTNRQGPRNMPMSPLYAAPAIMGALAENSVPIMIDCFSNNPIQSGNHDAAMNSNNWGPFKMAPEAEENPFGMRHVQTFDSFVQNVLPPAYEYPSNLEPVPLPVHHDRVHAQAAAPSDYDWVGFGQRSADVGAANNFVTDNSNTFCDHLAMSNMNMKTYMDTFNLAQEEPAAAPCWPTNASVPFTAAVGANASLHQDNTNVDDDAIFKTIMEDASGNMMMMGHLLKQTPLNDDGDLGNFMDLLVE
jgi:hypothetical protein